MNIIPIPPAPYIHPIEYPPDHHPNPRPCTHSVPHLGQSSGGAITHRSGGNIVSPIRAVELSRMISHGQFPSGQPKDQKSRMVLPN